MAFLAASLVFFVIWIFLFIESKPKHRKNILLSSLFWGIGGMIEGYYLFSLDWVDPVRLLDAFTGMEYFIGGFGLGGSLNMLRMDSIKKLEKIPRQHFLLNKYTPVVLSIIYLSLRMGLTLCFEVHSFYSLVWAIVPIVLFLFWLIPEMIVDVLKTTTLFFFFTLIHIQMFFWVGGSSAETYWLWEQMPVTTTFLRMPILDIIWGIVVPAFIRSLRLLWAVTDK